MSLEVIDANGLATVQDTGRRGWGRFGVPTSGAMDLFSARAANALLSNTPDCAVIEIGMGEITLRALHDCVISVTGAGYGVSIYVWDFPLWSSFFVRGGWTVRLNKMGSGMSAYIAVTGGVHTQPVLGSRSTYLRGAFGGLDGRQLQVGDVLRSGRPSASLSELASRTLPVAARPPYDENPTIDVTLGPQSGYFTEQSIETFLSSEYSISLTSDRMGYRLDGPPAVHKNKAELLSEGMTFGSIQIPASGQPIAMMADCPTTGGYPKIAAVTSADLPLLAQCTPKKSKIRFRETTVEHAQRKYRALMQGLERIVED